MPPDTKKKATSKPVTPEPSRALVNCINNAKERQGYVGFALAKSLEEARSEEEVKRIRNLIGASNIIYEKLGTLLAEESPRKDPKRCTCTKPHLGAFKVCRRCGGEYT